MDYGNPINKNDLRDILNSLPNTQQNAALAHKISDMLSRQDVVATPYTYSAVYSVTGAANSLAAGATSVVTNVQIQADADFLVLNQTFNANTANAAVTASSFVWPNATVLLVDTGSGYQMMDQPVPVTSIFGSGQFPYVLPEPKLLKARATLQVQVTNHDAAAGMNLYLNFNGVKLTAYN